ncbi:hypothetical protein B0H17DRAFT_1277859 [Mycena rosella]|uniref:Uncharacterized protein n=1 Tax=Mycena rosella TaxID=1033263 RepID=A0AAD7C2Y9_MYCRO|nr:hypothetical protein B0H17DRAFT_1277859 [Mycena rosella]
MRPNHRTQTDEGSCDTDYGSREPREEREEDTSEMRIFRTEIRRRIDNITGIGQAKSELRKFACQSTKTRERDKKRAGRREASSRGQSRAAENRKNNHCSRQSATSGRVMQCEPSLSKSDQNWKFMQQKCETLCVLARRIPPVAGHSPALQTLAPICELNPAALRPRVHALTRLITHTAKDGSEARAQERYARKRDGERIQLPGSSSTLSDPDTRPHAAVRADERAQQRAARDISARKWAGDTECTIGSKKEKNRRIQNEEKKKISTAQGKVSFGEERGESRDAGQRPMTHPLGSAEDATTTASRHRQGPR